VQVALRHLHCSTHAAHTQSTHTCSSPRWSAIRLRCGTRKQDAQVNSFACRG